jgi:hypothetical protein
MLVLVLVLVMLVLVLVVAMLPVLLLLFLPVLPLLPKLALLHQATGSLPTSIHLPRTGLLVIQAPIGANHLHLPIQSGQR